MKSTFNQYPLILMLLLLLPLCISAQNLSQDLLNRLNSQGSLGEAVLTDIHFSENSQLENPAEFILDGDEASSFALTRGSRQGWIRLDFEEEVYLNYLQFQGYLPRQAVFSLSTEIDGHSITLPSGYASGESSSFFLDLSETLCYSDNLTIRVEGENLTDLKIEEIELGSSSTHNSLHKKQLIPRSMEYSMHWLNQDFLLLDGKIGTIWSNQARGFGNSIYWLTPQGIEEKYHSFEKWRLKDELIYDLTTPGELSFLKIFLSDSASGILEIQIKMEESWISLAQWDLQNKSGWQQISLEDYDPISSIKLIMEDPRQTWQPGEYGGIGELEIWGKENPRANLLVDILSPVYPYNEDTALFQLSEIEQTDYSIKIVQDTHDFPPEPAFDIMLNGHSISTEEFQDYDALRIWDFKIPHHFLQLQDNLIHVSTGAPVYSAHLYKDYLPSLRLSDPAYSDGRRYSGEVETADYRLLDLLDGEADIEEILLYFDENPPQSLILKQQDIDQARYYPSTGALPYRISEESWQQEGPVSSHNALIDQIELTLPGDTQEIEIKGSQNRIAQPWIQILFPQEDSKLPQNTTYHYKVIGICDSPDGDIRVNGVPASVRDNYFWVETRDLNISQPGEYSLSAQVIAPNGQSARDEVVIQVESDSDHLSLDQEDILYTTLNENFLLSGKVSGNSRKLRINNQVYNLAQNGKFELSIPLEMGLNFLTIELLSRDESTVQQSESRRIYRQALEPELIISTPEDGSISNQSRLKVEGRVSPWGLEGVEINGQQAQIYNGRFMLSDFSLSNEVNIINVTASYQTGARVSKSIEVIKDQTPPVISGVSPVDNSMIGADWVQISGKVNDFHGVTLFINGLTAQVTGEDFTCLAPLPQEGNNLIRISARDKAGNLTLWPEFMLFRDLTGPEDFEVTIDPAGWTNDTRPEITFATTDASIGMSHYEVSLNKGPFVERQSPFKLPFLSDGQIPVVVRAYDQFMNYTDASTRALIDTVPPDDPSDLKAIPGNTRITLRWTEEDTETAYYLAGLKGSAQAQRIDRDEAFYGDEGKMSFQYIAEGLDAYQSYDFYVQAVDRAGNRGNRVSISSQTSMVRSENTEGDSSRLEYDSLSLFVPSQGLDKVVDHIILREEEDSEMIEDAVNPVVSPVYSLSVANDQYGEAEHVDFEKPFVAEISYDEEILAQFEDIPEHKLGVFYYDEDWNRWFLTADNYIDTENNRIRFACDHFSSFTIQPTSQEAMDYRQWKGIDYPLSSESTSHSPLSVSAQMGSVNTAMTEFILPGRNGLDFVLKRTYSSTVADSDSSLLPLNTMSTPKGAFWENLQRDEQEKMDPEELLNSYLDHSESIIKNWQQSRYRDLFYKRAEIGLALGQGWRLDLPYVKFTDKHVMINIPDQGFLFTQEMYRSGDQGDITFTDTLQGKGTVTLDRTAIGGGRFRLKGISFSSKNGIKYRFSNGGQIESITDPYGNRIEFHYEDLKLKNIIDSYGRGIFFNYYDEELYQNFVPLVKDIVVLNAYQMKEAFGTDSEKIRDLEYADISQPLLEEAGFTTHYSYDLDQPESAGLPLLQKAIDVGGREWNYQYTKMYLQSDYGEPEIYTRYVYDTSQPKIDTDGDEIPDSYPLKKESVRSPTFYPENTKTQYVFPLSRVTGPGVGNEKVIYGSNLYTKDIEGIDYQALEQTYRSYNSKSSSTIRKIKHMAMAMMASRIETFDGESDLKKTTHYSYSLNDEGKILETTIISENALNKEKLKERFHFSDKKYILDYPDTESFFGLIKHDNQEEVMATLQTRYRSYIKQDEEWVLVQDKQTHYHDLMQLPILETTRLGDFNDAQKIEDHYSYDSWGNTLSMVHKEMAQDYVNTLSTWNWYTPEPDLPDDIGLPESPLEKSEIDSSIHDRLLGTYSIAETGNPLVTEESIPRYSVFQYNNQGSLVESAEQKGEEWIRNSYQYDEWGDLSDQTNPLELSIHIDRMENQAGYDIIRTTEKDIPDEEWNDTDRVTEIHIDKLAGWTLKEVRADNQEITMERDRLGRMTRMVQPKEEEEEKAPVIRVEYDDAVMQVTQYDPLENYQIYDFNNRGEIEKIEKFNAAGESLQTTLIEQDYFGNIASVTTPNQEVLYYEYDGYGRILKESCTEQEQELSVSYNYIPWEHRRVITDERGLKTIEYLDPANRVIKTEELSRYGNVLRTTRKVYNGRGELAVQIDGRGYETRYSYNQQGNRIHSESPTAQYIMNDVDYESPLHSWKSYNTLGQVDSEWVSILHQGEEIQLSKKDFSYDKLGRLKEEKLYYTHPLEESPPAITKHYYNLLDQEVKTQDPNDEIWKKTYTLRGQVQTETNPHEGITTSYGYDLKDRLTSMTDPRENSKNYNGFDGTVIYHYDALDRLEYGILPSRAGEAQRKIRFNYDAQGNLLSRVDAHGGVTTYSYTEQNRVQSEGIQKSIEATESFYTTHYSYTETGQISEITMPNGASQSFEYDDLGRRIAETLPQGINRTFGYDLNDNLTWQQNGRGFRKWFQYDALNRRTQTQDEASQLWTTSYDPLGNISQTIDPMGVSRKMRYDGRGSLTQEEDGQGHITRYVYDNNGNLKTLTDPRGTVISYNYREDNLPTSVDYQNTDEAKEQHLVYSYDEAGGLKSARDGNIQTYYNRNDAQQYVPDPMGKITRQETVGYSDVTYSYNRMDQMTSITNGTHPRISYEYNTLNQLTSVTGFISLMNYNDAGLLKAYTMENGITSGRTYDQKNRLATLSYSLNEVPQKEYDYHYDSADNLVMENDNNFLYDARNMLLTAMLADESIDPTLEPLEKVELNQALDDVLGQKEVSPLDLKVPDPLSEEFQFDWGAQSLTANLGYPYIIGKLELHLSGPASSRISKDSIQILTSMGNRQNQFTESQIDSFKEEQTADGSFKVTIMLANPVPAQYVKIHSHYNDRDLYYQALNGQDYSTVGLDRDKPISIYQRLGGGRNEFYLYDNKGNREQKAIMFHGTQVSPCSYYKNSDWLKSDGHFGYSYDNNGNLIRKGSQFTETEEDSIVIKMEEEYWEYEYDLRNRLTEIRKWNMEDQILEKIARFTYDINGYRIKKINKKGESTQYVFDQSGNMIEEIDHENHSTQYVFMGGTHIAQINSDESVYYFGTNHLGSTTLVTDEEGAIIEDMTGETNPFGDQENKDIFFTGKQWDEDAELYYFNARWYDPETGRFITEDPIKDGLLWFAYVNNNPMGFVDPTGLEYGPSAEYLDSLGASDEEIKEITEQNNSSTDIPDTPSILPPYKPSKPPVYGSPEWTQQQYYKQYMDENGKLRQTHPGIQQTPENNTDDDVNTLGCYVMSMIGLAQTVLGVVFDEEYVNQIIDYEMGKGSIKEGFTGVTVDPEIIINDILRANDSYVLLENQGKNSVGADYSLIGNLTSKAPPGPHYHEGNQIGNTSFDPDPNVQLKDPNDYVKYIIYFKAIFLR